MVDKEKEMTPRESQEIQFLQQHHFSADTISKSMKIPVEKICDILGYPKDKEGRIAAHKDYNFYEFGADHKAEYYSIFLEEGDFEKWQPACYMDKSSTDFHNLWLEAEAIAHTDDPLLEARRYWILMRFPEYQLGEYKILRDKFVLNINKVKGITIGKRI